MRPKDNRSPDEIRERLGLTNQVDAIFALELGHLADHEMFRKLKTELRRHVGSMRTYAYHQGATDEADWLADRRTR